MVVMYKSLSQELCGQSTHSRSLLALLAMQVLFLFVCLLVGWFVLLVCLFVCWPVATLDYLSLFLSLPYYSCRVQYIHYRLPFYTHAGQFCCNSVEVLGKRRL